MGRVNHSTTSLTDADVCVTDHRAHKLNLILKLKGAVVLPIEDASDGEVNLWNVEAKRSTECRRLQELPALAGAAVDARELGKDRPVLNDVQPKATGGDEVKAGPAKDEVIPRAKARMVALHLKLVACGRLAGHRLTTLVSADGFDIGSDDFAKELRRLFIEVFYGECLR